MKSLLAGLTVAFCVSVGYSADTAKKAENECRMALDKNFNAIVYEDADALLATISPDTGTPEQFAAFREEAETMFANTDVYMHCVAFKMQAYNPPFADVLVVQQTTPKSESDHYPLEQGELNFRHRSALLPEHKLVVYLQRFQRKNGQWKLHLVLSEPQPISDDDVDMLNEKVSAEPVNCPDGRCSSPFIRAR